MNEKALQLGSRFALPPNSLGYCGDNSAPEKFKNCVINGKCEEVSIEFTKFIVLHPYLKTISQIAKLPFDSYNVIESYWLGNNLLKKAKIEHYDILLDNFLKQGVPEWLVNELKIRKPKVFIPTHLFQVLHVGVGKASGSVLYNLSTINNCAIQWGVVEKIKRNIIEVELNSLKKTKNKHLLTTTTKTLPFVPEFLPKIKPGNVVAVHWKQVVKILTKQEEKKLKYWTEQVLDSLN